MGKLTLFAMTKKGYSVVKLLLSTYPGIVDAVVSARDSGIANDFFGEIANLCTENSVPFYSRTDKYSIKTPYVLAVSWRWLLDVRASRLVVFHDSLLPRYRGFNPLVTSLINGDDEIGVTAVHAGKEYDCGNIIARSASSIQYPITIQEAIETILSNYEALTVRIAECVIHDSLPDGSPQVEAEASYSLWRDGEDYFIDWAGQAARIRRMVDALGHPYKGAASTLNGRVVRILKAEAVEDVVIENRTPGKVIFLRGSKPVVVCGNGLLRIDELIDDIDGRALLPLSGFRARFKGCTEPFAGSGSDGVRQ